MERVKAEAERKREAKRKEEEIKKKNRSYIDNLDMDDTFTSINDNYCFFNRD